jgi:hypothetical protein
MKTLKTTASVIQEYYDGLNQKKGWEYLIDDHVIFTGPGQVTHGKDDYVAANKRFLHVVKSLSVKELIIDGEKVCALIEYQLQSPKGNTTICEVAELLTIVGHLITSSKIFFDTSLFKNFMAQG